MYFGFSHLLCLQALRDTADFKVKNNQACLEACLRTLIMTMQQVRLFYNLFSILELMTFRIVLKLFHFSFIANIQRIGENQFIYRR